MNFQSEAYWLSKAVERERNPTASQILEELTPAERARLEIQDAPDPEMKKRAQAIREIVRELAEKKAMR